MKRRDYYIMEEGMEEGEFIDWYSNLVLKKRIFEDPITENAILFVDSSLVPNPFLSQDHE
jgi:hypothetical protein